MSRTDLEPADEARATAAVLDRFRRAAGELAAILHTVGRWPSTAALDPFDLIYLRYCLACAAAFIAYAIAELADARRVLDAAAKGVRFPDQQAKGARHD